MASEVSCGCPNNLPIDARNAILLQVDGLLAGWKGFPDGAGIPGAKSIWEIFSDGNEALKKLISTVIAAELSNESFAENILYINFCLLNPQHDAISTPGANGEEYDYLVDNGWGIIDFNNHGAKYGWAEIKTNPETRKGHFSERASLFSICHNSRIVGGLDDPSKCHITAPENNNCNFLCFSKTENVPDNSPYKQACKRAREADGCGNPQRTGNCETKFKCGRYDEQVVLFISKDKQEVKDSSDIVKRFENGGVGGAGDDKFTAYKKFLAQICNGENGYDPYYYIRKPLVKGPSNFTRGEIYLAVRGDKDIWKDAEKQKAFLAQARIVIRAVRDYIGIPLLMRQLEKEQNDLVLSKKDLAKQAQMLDLLMGPLSSLTEALNTTQKDAQKLRAILYDPQSAIFAAAPRVERYYTEGATVGIGSLSWRPVHNFRDGKDANLTVLKNTISVIILEILGLSGTFPIDNEKLLWNVATVLYENPGPEHAELMKTIQAIFSCASNKKIDSMNIKDACTIASAFKNILFDPFKPQSKNFPILPICTLAFGFFENATFIFNNTEYKSLSGAANAFADKEQFLFSSDRGIKLPVPQYSQFLALIGGILSYAKSDKQAKCVHITINNENPWGFLSGAITFATDVFDVANLKNDLFPDMKLIAERKLAPGFQGNFKKPFCDFSYCVSRPESNEFSVYYDMSAITYIHNDCYFRLNFAKESMYFSFGKRAPSGALLSDLTQKQKDTEFLQCFGYSPQVTGECP